MPIKSITLTQKAAARVLAEWERRWRESPELYRKEIELLQMKNKSETYGDSAARYLLHLCKQMGEG